MFVKKSKVMEMEKELKSEQKKLSTKYKSKAKGVFAIGASVGVLLTLGGHKLVKVVPVDKIKDQVEKVKEIVSKKIGKASDNVEETIEELEDELEKESEEVVETKKNKK